MISTFQIQTSAKKYWVDIWSLKCKILRYIYNHKKVKATDLDSSFWYSAGRRANDLKKRWLLEVLTSEPILGKANERFYYSLSKLGTQIMTDASIQTLANKEKWNSMQQNDLDNSDHLQVWKIPSNHSKSETLSYQSNEIKKSDLQIKTGSIGESSCQFSQKQDIQSKSFTSFLKKCFSRKTKDSQS